MFSMCEYAGSVFAAKTVVLQLGVLARISESCESVSHGVVMLL